MRATWRRRSYVRYWRDKHAGKLGRQPLAELHQQRLEEQRERVEMALPLLQRGLSKSEIARQLHVARRTVQRYARILEKEGRLDAHSPDVG